MSCTILWHIEDSLTVMNVERACVLNSGLKFVFGFIFIEGDYNVC